MQIVAIKVIKTKADDCTDEQLKDFNDESKLLRSVFHTNIVRLIGTGKNAEGKPFIVLEYMERGSVRHELDTNNAHTPPELNFKSNGLWMQRRVCAICTESNKCIEISSATTCMLINDRGVVKTRTKDHRGSQHYERDRGSGNGFIQSPRDYSRTRLRLVCGRVQLRNYLVGNPNSEASLSGLGSYRSLTPRPLRLKVQLDL